MRGDAILFRLDIAVEQQPGEPAAADADAVFFQDRSEHCRVEREAASGFHAGEAGNARLPQAFLQRNVIAQLGKIVVPPGDGGDAQFGFHLFLQ